MISNWAIYANGEQFELLTGGPLSYYTVRIFLTNKLIRTEDGSIMPRTLGLTISRSVGGGLHEDLDITNNSMKPIRFQLEIVIRSDFADIFEVKSGQIVRRGQITTVESVSTSWISASGATVKRHSLRCSRGRPVLSSAVRCHRNSHGSRTCRDAAHVAEVEVAKDGAVRIRRVVCAVDCGTVVNPDTIRAQVESGIIFGIAAALHGEITLKDDRVQQTNFDTYQVLRMNEAPAIEVHIVQNFEPPGGMGECGTSAIVPAVTNAIFAATGKRLRKLPVDTAALRQAL